MIRRAFFALLLVVTVVKLAIVFSGADYDGDAYAHAMAGRRMLLDPTDVTVHWVWLPLLHCLYSIATLAGSGLTALRVANALIGGASALVLVRILRDHLASAGASPPSISPSAAGAPSSLAGPDSLVPWLAGALLALDPLGLWLGVTGQTEPLFQLLILLGCLACQHRSFTAAGALFAASALTRYEAWPLIPVLFWLSLRPETPRSPEGAGQSSPEGAAQSSPEGAAQSPSGEELPPLVVLGAPRLRAPLPPKRRASAPRGGPITGTLRAQPLWLLPAAAVAAWCLFHHRCTGEPLQFLRLNREFVDGYLAGVGYPWGRQPLLPLMAVFYVTVVPVWNMLGPVHLLTIAGVFRVFRDLPRPFLLVSAALLAIVTAGFVRRTHLGLPRHAVAFAPLFSALVATGALHLADSLSRRRRPAPPAAPRPDPDPSSCSPSAADLALSDIASSLRLRKIAALSLLAIVLLTRTTPKAIELFSVTRKAFQEQAIAARALREIAAPDEPILCDDGKIEVLSALAPARFLRWQVPDVAPSHLADLARPKGSALVVATPSRTAHLPGGQLLWRGDHLVIYRFESSDF